MFVTDTFEPLWGRKLCTKMRSRFDGAVLGVVLRCMLPEEVFCSGFVPFPFVALKGAGLDAEGCFKGAGGEFFGVGFDSAAEAPFVPFVNGVFIGITGVPWWEPWFDPASSAPKFTSASAGNNCVKNNTRFSFK